MLTSRYNKMTLNYEQIFKEVDDISADKVMELMRTVINIDTTVPPCNTYPQLVKAVKPYFEKLGFRLEEVVQPDELVKQMPHPLEGPRVNLVATKDYKQKSHITFYAHMDVVPAPNEGKEKWRFPPFEATMIKSGKIYGRGVSDMKGSIPCVLLAFEIIERLKLKPKYNVIVTLCTDEELGVYPGVRYLAEKGYVKGTIFCMEGVVNPLIPIGSAGCLNIIVETIGRSCHSGMNFMGVNALEEMTPIMVELMKLKKIVEERQSEDIPGFPRFGTGEKRNMSPMFNLDIIRSGEKENIVPDSCKLTINRRLIPEEKYEDVRQEILDAIDAGKKNSKALDIKVTFVYDYPALRVNPNAPDVKRMKKVISVVQNTPEDKIPTIGMSGSTDMGFIAQILKTNDIIMHGVGNPGSNMHAVNETIKLEDVKTYIKELIVFLCADFS